MTRLALLPAAKYAPMELRAEFGPIPGAMVPLDSRPALHHIAQRYEAQGFEVAVAVHEGAHLIESYLDRTGDLKVRVLGIGDTSSLGETVLRALRRIGDEVDQLVVNFADTLVDERIPDGDAIYYQEQSDTYRWTTFGLDGASRICDLVEKGRVKAPGPQRVFVGLFAVADVGRFRQELETACAHAGSDTVALDTFYTAVRRYFNGLAAPAVALRRAERWNDFGHLDTYYATKRTFFVNKRFFNEVRVDTTRGVIRKTSRNVDKFLDEIGWYLKLPPSLSHVAPRVFGYCLERDDPWVELEFYGYPTLNDAYLVGRWDLGLWAQVLHAVDGLLDQLGAHRPAADEGAAAGALRTMYEHKTMERLREVAGEEHLAAFQQERVIVNGRPCLGIPAVLSRLPDLLAEAGVYDQRPMSVIHGDLCLSNILYDRRNSIVRVVDPRGRFGPYDLYGDPLYDLAKLAHSIDGDYDFFVNGLFDIAVEGDEVTLEAHLEAHHRVVKTHFGSWLAERSGRAAPAVQAIEGLLFLSMVPLHADRPRSQQAFLARGLELLADVDRRLTTRR